MANTKIKSSAERRALRKKREELVGNRLLLIFCIAALGLLVLSVMQNKRFCATHYYSSGEITALWVIGVISAIVLVAGVVWHFAWQKKGVDQSQHAFNGFGLASIGLCMLVSTALIGATDSLGYRVSYLFVSLIAGLALTRVIFSREFFVVGTSFGFGTVLFYYCYMLRRSLVFVWNPWKLLLIVFGLAMAVEAVYFAVLCIKKLKNGEKLSLRKMPIVPCLCACVLLGCAFAALVILQADLSVLSVYVAGIGLAASVVYYGLRLI
ncbi:MAG: hypothetical protein IKM04_00025 [Clostridia bacterium]|nr:hypothetical protein [Clostridia bacterium]